MALINCPDCDKQFSDAAQACPNCARPNKPIKSEEREAESSSPEQAKPEKTNLEAIGFIIILVSMGGCAMGLIGSGGSSASGLIFGSAGLVIGLVVFIAGRFQKWG